MRAEKLEPALLQVCAPATGYYWMILERVASEGERSLALLDGERQGKKSDPIVDRSRTLAALPTATVAAQERLTRVVVRGAMTRLP